MTPNKVQEVAESAFWRQPHNRKTHWQALAALPFRSPLLGAPFFTLEILQLDGLHIVDLGVAQVLLGSAFKVLCGKFPGSFEQQCKALHGRMKFWYSVHQTQSRLDQLKPKNMHL